MDMNWDEMEKDMQGMDKNMEDMKDIMHWVPFNCKHSSKSFEMSPVCNQGQSMSRKCPRVLAFSLSIAPSLATIFGT